MIMSGSFTENFSEVSSQNWQGGCHQNDPQLLGWGPRGVLQERFENRSLCSTCHPGEGSGRPQGLFRVLCLKGATRFPDPRAQLQSCCVGAGLWRGIVGTFSSLWFLMSWHGPEQQQRIPWVPDHMVTLQSCECNIQWSHSWSSCRICKGPKGPSTEEQSTGWWCTKSVLHATTAADYIWHCGQHTMEGLCVAP